MDVNDRKILQGVVSGIGQIHEELKLVRKEMKDGDEKLREEMKEGFEKVNSRLDKLGFSLAELEDDAPTREEFDELSERVDKIQHQFLTN